MQLGRLSWDARTDLWAVVWKTRGNPVSICETRRRGGGQQHDLYDHAAIGQGSCFFKVYLGVTLLPEGLQMGFQAPWTAIVSPR